MRVSRCGGGGGDGSRSGSGGGGRSGGSGGRSGGGECAAGDVGHVTLDDEGVVDDVPFGVVVENGEWEELSVAPSPRSARPEGARRRLFLKVVLLVPLADQRQVETSVLAPGVYTRPFLGST